MNLYLLKQDKNTGWDTYDSAVVCAECDDDARMIHPSGKEWDGTSEGWESWCDARDVTILLIGKSNHVPEGVVCSSFNAG